MGRFLEMAKRMKQEPTKETNETKKSRSPRLVPPVNSFNSFISSSNVPSTICSNTGEKPEPPFTEIDRHDDDGRRVWVKAMGELLGWPRLPLGGAETLAAGRDAWARFTAHPANAELIERAVAVLMEIDGLPEMPKDGPAAAAPDGVGKA